MFYSTITLSITRFLFRLTFSKLLVINFTSQSIAAITYCVITTYYAGRDRIAIMLDSPWHAYDQTRFTISESGVLERIEIRKENELTKDNRIIKSVLHLKWNIAELLFARQRMH